MTCFCPIACIEVLLCQLCALTSRSSCISTPSLRPCLAMWSSWTSQLKGVWKTRKGQGAIPAGVTLHQPILAHLIGHRAMRKWNHIGRCSYLLMQSHKFAKAHCKGVRIQGRMENCSYFAQPTTSHIYCMEWLCVLNN